MSFGVVCPRCRCELASIAPGKLRCSGCAAEYDSIDGFPDLTLGQRFDDEPPDEVCQNEERTGRFLANGYLQPLLQRLYPDRAPASVRVLSVGCGVGAAVEGLLDLGYDAWGIDPGNRSAGWKNRRCSDRFLLANALHLPFPDNSFDLVELGCVIPHIGVDGDTYVTTPDFAQLRARAALELVRVAKPSAYIMLSSPNRLCPLDLFHRHGRLTHLPRVHGLGEKFLLSFEDYRKLMVETAACSSIELLPVQGYWGFFTSSTYALGRLLQLPVKGFLAAMSWKPLRWLLGSALNPWLIVLARK